MADVAPPSGDTYAGARLIEGGAVCPPMVGIGASAGGLEAMKELLAAMPDDTGAFFVFVQHLDPDHKSMQAELLGRCTSMAVLDAEDGMAADANRLVIIPPNATLTISGGVLRLARPAPPRTHRTPIDTFFRSLASDQGERAIAIVLSGTGSDGTHGLKAVKEAGGFTIIQDPATAKYDSMPRNGEATGLVDLVLPPSEMPACIVEYLEHLREDAERAVSDADRSDPREDLEKVCSHLKSITGHDFRDYKEPTLQRRVQRRMQVLRIREMSEYVERLRDDRKEVRQLFREMSVSITSFFRDPDAFDAVESKVVNALVGAKGEGDTIRVWVSGCATGEEAYSLAMILRDTCEAHGKGIGLQVIATDIDEAALEVARRGIYPDSIAGYVPERFIRRFLRPAGGDYQISDEIRQLCIFSTQSLIKDPPFSRIDLISCRNVLIYLKAELQNRLIPVFHYALRPDGFLFLGPSENLSRHDKLFRVVDKKWRIFQRRQTSGRRPLTCPLLDLVGDDRRGAESSLKHGATKSDPVLAAAERAILDDLGPAYAVVGKGRELVYSGGSIDRYLKLQRGTPSLEILTIAHESLRLDLRALLHRAAMEQGDAVRDNVAFPAPEGQRRLTLVCRPLGDDRTDGQHYLIVFRDNGLLPTGQAPLTDGDGRDGQVRALETELRETREYLQTATEELESANEELKSANEELMSMNEELQSSNEELETSKEELQSLNEELGTVNAELASKVEELADAHADLQNLLESTQIATLFLDQAMRVRRFTPVARDVFHLISADVGRPIGDITTRIENVDLAAEARNVFETLTPVEREVSVRDDGDAYIMRLLPLRTPKEVIIGVVATFVNVSRLKKAQDEIASLNIRLQAQVADLAAVLDLAPIGIAFADDPTCAQIEVNRYGSQIMSVPRRVLPADRAKAGYRFQRNGVEIPAKDLPLQTVWRTGKPVEDFRATYVPPKGAPFEFLMSATPVLDDDGRVRRVIGVYDNITRLVEAQAAAETRAAQQDFVATTGSRSLRGQSGGDLFAALPEDIARLLDVDLAEILIHEPESDAFRVRSAFGLDDAVGSLITVGGTSLAGYTVQSGAPVIIDTIADEKRFSVPEYIRASKAATGINVLIGDPQHPLGLLNAYSCRHRVFTADDVKFLQSVANIVAATLQRDAWRGQQRLLRSELRHRVKNLLAMVQAIAALSFRSPAPRSDAVRNFIARLEALGRVHDLQFHSNWKEIDFGELVLRQIEPYDASGVRIRCAGATGIRLPSELAVDMAMAIHELTTNAAKHGALSRDGGSVALSWRREMQGDGSLIIFEWAEHDGPPIDEPAGEGIGSKLLQAIGRRSAVTLTRSLDRDGVRCRIEIRLPGPSARDGDDV
ncbi:MAG: PAS domain-containing protein [Rhodospirillales bacterium]|nr:PAS domain-containing protein [Rhodospirillales bacterium]